MAERNGTGSGVSPAVVVIAGCDPSGGAGLSRDIDTIAKLGATARPVVTAVTAQTDRAVTRIDCLSPGLVADQLDAALDGGAPDAVKIGMVGNASIIETLATRLRNPKAGPVVLDPVLAATSGRVLLNDAGRRLLVELLLPLASIVTPNLLEAAILTGRPPAEDDSAIASQAEFLLKRGAGAVLIKGGHAVGAQAVDHLYSSNGRMTVFAAARRSGTARGSGCSLASAISTLLAGGADIEDACRRAKTFLLQTRFDQRSFA